MEFDNRDVFLSKADCPKANVAAFEGSGGVSRYGWLIEDLGRSMR
jgi:hypothetical protein